MVRNHTVATSEFIIVNITFITIIIILLLLEFDKLGNHTELFLSNTVS